MILIGRIGIAGRWWRGVIDQPGAASAARSKKQIAIALTQERFHDVRIGARGRTGKVGVDLDGQRICRDVERQRRTRDIKNVARADNVMSVGSIEPAKIEILDRLGPTDVTRIAGGCMDDRLDCGTGQNAQRSHSKPFQKHSNSYSNSPPRSVSSSVTLDGVLLCGQVLRLNMS